MDNAGIIFKDTSDVIRIICSQFYGLLNNQCLSDILILGHLAGAESKQIEFPAHSKLLDSLRQLRRWTQMDVDGDGYTEYVLAGTEAGTSAPQRGYSIMFQGDQQGQTSSNSYYIDGKMYDGWDKVPEQYKKASAPKTTQPGIRLKN